MRQHIRGKLNINSLFIRGDVWPVIINEPAQSNLCIWDIGYTIKEFALMYVTLGFLFPSDTCIIIIYAHQDSFIYKLIAKFTNIDVSPAKK